MTFKSLLRKILFVSTVGLVACSSLPYQDDIGFLVSAQANSPEFPVYLNGTICKDMDGNPGLCSKRIKSTDTLKFSFDPQVYAYDLTIACTNPISVAGGSVGANQGFEISITPDQMQGLKSFVCIGEVFPQDRTQPLSAKFEIRIVVADVNYVARERITTTTQNGDTYLVLGQYARSAWVFDGEKWSLHTKDTMVKLKDPAKAKAYSESYNMRFNYLNMTEPPASGTVEQ